MYLKTVDAHNLNYFYGDISKSDAEDLLKIWN